MGTRAHCQGSERVATLTFMVLIGDDMWVPTSIVTEEEASQPYLTVVANPAERTP